MAAIQINRTVDLSRMVQPEALTGVTFTEESGGHEFVLTAKDEVLSGTIKARFMRGDGSTTEFFGNTVDGVAHLTLTADCYEVAGRFLLTVFYDGGDGMAVIYAAVGHVVKSSNGAVTPSQPAAQSFEDILAGYVQQMTSAKNAANTAADAASAAAANASAAAASSVRYDVSQSLTEVQQEQARENIGVVDKGLSDTAKTALLDCFAHVVWIDEHGQTYYNALRSALYAESYPKLTAVFNPGLHVVYTDDALDTLKPYLTVTYYETVESTGAVVAANDYTLSGTLVDGLSTVLVQNDALVTAVRVEAVDYYNQNQWTLTSGEISCQPGGDHIGKYTDAYPYDEGKAYISNVGGQLTKRRAIVVGRGVMPYRLTSNNQDTEYYPVPVPEYANKVTVTITPATVEWNGNIANYDNGIYTLDEQFGWASSGVSETFNSGRNKFFIVALRADSKNSAFATEPAEIIIDYAED